MILNEDESKNKEIPYFNGDSVFDACKKRGESLLSFSDCRYFESISP